MIARRMLSITLVSSLWVAWIALAPVWLVSFTAVDLMRGRERRGVALRCGCMAMVYLTCELGGLIIAGALWAARRVRRIDDDAWEDIHFRLEAAWGAMLFRSMAVIFKMTIDVDGESQARLGEGPYVLLVRHSSIADTLLASALVSRSHGIRLRYVLKKELLVDPCLDIVGHRLPNAFVDRDSDDSQREIGRVEAIARGLGPRDGVLIYPEGTRYTDAKRARLATRFDDKGDAAMSAYLRALPPGVLPPRPGGTLALLSAAPSADVVVCAHGGFEGAASLGAVWRGALVGRSIRVHFERFDRSDIPKEPDLQRRWLFDEWTRVGEWVAAHAPSRGPGAR
jgi:1-acyl-sn-glycerol-3-phosphate acyltransferase